MLARIRDRKDQEGFTLIELLVVMIIIGILAAIAIPIFLNQRKSAHDAAIKSDLRSAATEIESFYVNSQHYPAAWASVSANVKTSPGNTLVYAYTSSTKTYCVTGTSPDASHAWYYSSGNGGLQAGTVTACP